MATEVRYYCPRCGTVVGLPRDGYLADRSVTPHSLAGWRYVAPDADDDAEGADGVRFVCGESGGCRWDGEGCGEPFYLSFVRYEDGAPVEAVPARGGERA